MFGIAPPDFLRSDPACLFFPAPDPADPRRSFRLMMRRSRRRTRQGSRAFARKRLPTTIRRTGPAAETPRLHGFRARRRSSVRDVGAQEPCGAHLPEPARYTERLEDGSRLVAVRVQVVFGQIWAACWVCPGGSLKRIYVGSRLWGPSAAASARRSIRQIRGSERGARDFGFGRVSAFSAPILASGSMFEVATRSTRSRRHLEHRLCGPCQRRRRPKLALDRVLALLFFWLESRIPFVSPHTMCRLPNVPISPAERACC